jgi:pseudouridine synthase
VYAVTVRGEVTDQEAARLRDGIVSGRERLSAEAVTVRRTSRRESHLLVELREGRNREVKRLFDAIGHEVTRLKRVSVGRLDLGGLEPGQWRELTRADVRDGLPGAPIDGGPGLGRPRSR